MPVYKQILAVLQRYLSEMNAAGTLDRTIRELGLHAEDLTFSDIARLLPKLERRARLYLDYAVHARLLAELTTLSTPGGGGGERSSRRSRVVPVQRESDVSDARMMAKAICEGVGARSFIVHKVATIVSELARNIIHYTPGGTIELGVIRDRPQRFSILAVDSGPGIANLEHILSGNYRSKTGMGRGLIGIKRLSERFNIDPGPPGTRIEVEVHL